MLLSAQRRKRQYGLHVVVSEEMLRRFERYLDHYVEVHPGANRQHLKSSVARDIIARELVRFEREGTIP